MSMRSLFVAALLLTPSLALAQEGEKGFTPSNAELDRELDESLRKEFDEPALPPPSKRSYDRDDKHGEDGKRGRRKHGKKDRDHDHDDDDRFELRLGGMVAHMTTRLQDVTISHREGSQGGAEWELDKVLSLNDDIDLDDLDSPDDVWQNTQAYKAWFDIGKHVSLQAGFWRTVYRQDGPAQEAFDFGRSSFSAGQGVETKFDMAVADFDLVVKPINNRYVSLDLHFGGRYIYWNTRVRRTDSATQIEDSSTLEAGVPMAGLGFTLRPLRWFQIYARGRAGYLAYERDAHYVYEGNGQYDYVENKRRKTVSGHVEGGVLFMFARTIGVTLGYRLDYLRVEREVDERESGFEAFSHGVFAGAVLEF